MSLMAGVMATTHFRTWLVQRVARGELIIDISVEDWRWNLARPTPQPGVARTAAALPWTKP